MSARGAARLFVLSGASGLVFELIWVRQLTLLTGHGAVAVSLVVAAFLGGLVLGGFSGGRLAARAPRPLRAYAALEALTGLSALGLTALLSRTDALQSALGAAPLGARIALAFVAVLAPTTAMGATLPVLTAELTRRGGDLGRSFASLYARNTLGAAAGCALAGFALIGRYGMAATAAMAAALDLAVALAALALDRGATPVPDAATTDSGDDRDPRFAIAAALTGFAAIACEVLWFRVLHAFVRSSTYAFTLMLVLFLLGLVLGGAAAARRRPASRGSLSELLVALSATVLLSVAVLGRAGTLVQLASRLVGGHGDADHDALHLLVGAAVLLPPTTVMGVSLPWIAALGARGPARVGALSAWNTLGGAAASLAVGLWLVPWWGAQRCLALAATLYLAAAWAVHERGRVAALARMSAAVLVAWALVPGDYLRTAVTRFPRARLLEVREGRDGTAAVLGYDRDTVCRASKNHCRGRCMTPFRYQQLIFGTVSYASTIPPARRYMRALAHLPMLLRASERPASVLEVCVGTGTTAGAFTTHDDLGRLTVVDINRDVLAMGRHFAESNHAFWRDPRVRAVVDDGRNHLASSPERWDVVSLEPPPPTAEGAATLYTEGFYRLVAARLRDDGVLAQWIPLDQQSGALDASMVASMLAVFPEVSLYIPARLEGVVLASRSPLTPDLGRWRARWERGRVAESLAEVGFSRPEDLLATFALDTRELRELVRAMGEAPMTDDRPRVEFYRQSPGAPFDVDAWLDRGAGPTRYASGDAVLRVAARARGERLLMRAWARSLTGDLEGARRNVADAVSNAGDDPYMAYQRALEFDCLNLDDP